MRINDARDAGGGFEEHRGVRPAWWFQGAVVVAAMLLSGCGRLQDEFRGDTEAGRIQLDVEQVSGASIDDVTQMGLRERERAYERVFTGRLPANAQVTVSASVAKFGVYRRGGGWVFEGQRFVGRYAVRARTLEATSSDPGCVAVQVEPALDRPAHDRVVLRAVQPCAARISLTVQPLDEAGRPQTGESVSDTLTITVAPKAS